MSQSREESIVAALKDLETGVHATTRAAAQAYGIPPSTLWTRRYGVNNRPNSHNHQQRLTPTQENYLADWVIEQDAQGYPPTHARLREMGFRIAAKNGDNSALGHDWSHGFLRRNPRIKSCVARPMDALRVKGGNREVIDAFFGYFQSVVDKYNVRPADIWNMDETGLAMGVCNNSYVFSSIDKHRAYTKTPHTREWVTIVEAVSAVGDHLRPLVLFKGKSVQQAWFTENIPDWHYHYSENGWTTDNIGEKWLEHIFLPESRRSNDSKRILLLDGHGSHERYNFMIQAHDSNVILVYLPSHTISSFATPRRWGILLFKTVLPQ